VSTPTLETAHPLRAARYVIVAGVVAALHVGKLPPALPVLRDVLGISLLQAGFLLSLVQLAGMTLGLLTGLAAQRIGLKRSMVAGLVVLGGLANGAGWLLAPRALEGLVFSMVGGLIPATLFSLAIRLAPSTDTVSTTVGWVQQWSALGQFAGPPLVAWVAVQAGGWQGTGWVTSACCAIELLLAWRIHRLLGVRTPLS